MLADVATQSCQSHAVNGSASATSAAVEELRPRRSYFAVRGVAERALAALLLVPLLPVIGVLVLLVRMTSRGPGLFRQARSGKDGRVFNMYKLRSMRADAEAKTGPVWAKQFDSRVTPLGYWLRRTHLDELPQLFNVLAGHMSFIGPRPERPEFVAVLSEQIPHYLDRLQVLPGITGLAQINLPPDTDLVSVCRKLVLDREYIRMAGLWLDVRVFACTGFRLLGIRNTAVVRLLGLVRSAELPDIMNPACACCTTVVPASEARDAASQPADVHSAREHQIAPVVGHTLSLASAKTTA